MATSTESTSSTPNFADLPSMEEASERIRDLNERLIESSKSAGIVALDAYEKGLQSLVDFETKVASASQLEWVSAVATTHAKFVTDLSASYSQAARDLLN
ncbi:hypothetical protein [Kribbella kalugense]|uniref:Phasin domain-containing protein n=1 Tax=Kribbella kalugense TaxID=2512221 RepID=A0A4V3G881_9ACTN|nr:hypothetical protein [Kribbella kalugense]TDW21924.1 hypothetical protein EV650_0755 [Kribbella kalugense]